MTAVRFAARIASSAPTVRNCDSPGPRPTIDSTIGFCASWQYKKGPGMLPRPFEREVGPVYIPEADADGAGAAPDPPGIGIAGGNRSAKRGSLTLIVAF